MSIADQLQKLQQLRETGAIDDQEFAAAKAKLLRDDGNDYAEGPLDAESLEEQSRFWGMLLHLSMLAGYVSAGAGFIAPIVIWQIKKDELPEIDEHGRNATNWLISKLIYFAIFLPLCLVGIGVPLLILLGILGVVFPIVAAIKANNGEVWRYPLSIPFF